MKFKDIIMILIIGGVLYTLFLVFKHIFRNLYKG